MDMLPRKRRAQQHCPDPACPVHRLFSPTETGDSRFPITVRMFYVLCMYVLAVVPLAWHDACRSARKALQCDGFQQARQPLQGNQGLD